MYQPPEPMSWPAQLRRPSCEQIGSAVLFAMNSPHENALEVYERKSGVSVVRYMYSLACQRIRGMSTVEVAGVLNAKSHSSFTSNGTWISEFCRSSAGTAAYNEIIKALVQQMEAVENQGVTNAI